MSMLTYEQALAKLYTKAEAQLIKTIKQKTAHGNATAYERSLLRQIDEQIKALQKSSDVTVQRLVKRNYKIGLDKLMQDISIDENAPNTYNLMSGLNTNQINIIVDNITSQLNQAIATVGRRCNDYVRQAALSATAKKLTTGQTVREMQKELETNLTNNNITSIKYANGTEHNIKDYAAMVARTTTAETQNTAQLVQGNAWGYDLVRMTSHYPTCEVCAMYQGRVYATTKEAANGKYKDKNGNPLLFPYIYDTVFVDGYDTVHPNCRHRFAIFPANAYTLDELAEFSKQSMQPFADTRSDEERKAYAKEQAIKRKRNESRRQYEDVKRYLPDQAPKTFAGWQRMKSAKSQRYQDLMEDYRYTKKVVANGSQNGIIGVEDSEADKRSRFLYNTLSRKERLEVINKGRSSQKPVFSYDTDENKFPSYAQNATKEKNTFDIISHGSYNSIEFFKQDYPEGDKRANIDPYTLSVIMKGRNDYTDFIARCKQNGDEPIIRLLSCDTGNINNTGDCFAQLLANELGVKVKAPTDLLFVNPDGTFYIGGYANKEMNMFYPRK